MLQFLCFTAVKSQARDVTLMYRLALSWAFRLELLHRQATNSLVCACARVVCVCVCVCVTVPPTVVTVVSVCVSASGTRVTDVLCGVTE